MIFTIPQNAYPYLEGHYFKPCKKNLSLIEIHIKYSVITMPMLCPCATTLVDMLKFRWYYYKKIYCFMKVFRFLHRFIKILSSVVSYLAITAILPQRILMLVIYIPLLSPLVITMVVFAVSLFLCIMPEQPKQRKWQKWMLSQNICHLLQLYKKTRFYHLVFGASKGIQSLTVIRYIRASLSLRRTIKTPIIAFLIAALSAISSLKQPNHQTAHITRETINFVLDAATSFGFLYLLNYTSPWSFPVLSLGLTLLTILGIFVEKESLKEISEKTIAYFSPNKKPKQPMHPRRNASDFVCPKRTEAREPSSPYLPGSRNLEGTPLGHPSFTTP